MSEIDSDYLWTSIDCDILLPNRVIPIKKLAHYLREGIEILDFSKSKLGTVW